MFGFFNKGDAKDNAAKNAESLPSTDSIPESPQESFVRKEREDRHARLLMARQRILETGGPLALRKFDENARPHRCVGHYNDMVYAMISIPWTMEFPYSIPLFFKCLVSSVGKEPARLYVKDPGESTSDIIQP